MNNPNSQVTEQIQTLREMLADYGKAPGRFSMERAALEAAIAALTARTDTPAPEEGFVVPDGWIVRRIENPSRPGDRWEIYNPEGSGGVVTTFGIDNWFVRELLDSLAARPQPAQGDGSNETSSEK